MGRKNKTHNKKEPRKKQTPNKAKAAKTEKNAETVAQVPADNKNEMSISLNQPQNGESVCITQEDGWGFLANMMEKTTRVDVQPSNSPYRVPLMRALNFCLAHPCVKIIPFPTYLRIFEELKTNAAEIKHSITLLFTTWKIQMFIYTHDKEKERIMSDRLTKLTYHIQKMPNKWNRLVAKIMQTINAVFTQITSDADKELTGGKIWNLLPKIEECVDIARRGGDPKNQLDTDGNVIPRKPRSLLLADHFFEVVPKIDAIVQRLKEDRKNRSMTSSQRTDLINQALDLLQNFYEKHKSAPEEKDEQPFDRIVGQLEAHLSCHEEPDKIRELIEEFRELEVIIKNATDEKDLEEQIPKLQELIKKKEGLCQPESKASVDENSDSSAQIDLQEGQCSSTEKIPQESSGISGQDDDDDDLRDLFRMLYINSHKFRRRAC